MRGAERPGSQTDPRAGASLPARAVALGAPVVGLAGLALVSPLLDLLGREPTYFVAQGFSSGQIIGFGLLVALGVPLVLAGLPILVDLLGAHRAAVAVTTTMVGLLAGTLAAVVAGNLELPALVVLPVAAAAGVGVVLARARWQPFEGLLRLLALGPVAFLALFLFASPTARLIWSEDPEALTGVGDPGVTVVVVVLDELPLAALVGDDLAIDDERFPHLADLAAGAHWFPNTTTTSHTTADAVPSALTGLEVRGTDRVPTAADHPRNLFTLLGGDRQTLAVEEVTALCPASVCGDVAPPDARRRPSPLRTGLEDAAVLLGHLVVPDAWAGWLPSTEDTWGGYLRGGATPVAADPDDAQAELDGAADADRLQRWLDGGMRAGADQAAALAAFVDGIDADVEGGLFVAHVIFPHRPWVLTPEGYVYADRGWDPGLSDNVWEEPEGARLAAQRLLWQAAHADRLIGRLTQRLRDEGLWEQTLLVVTADHGGSFLPGHHRRDPVAETAGEILWVPLAVKLPGQTEGERHDTPATLADVLPTIMAALDVDPGWELDGADLLASQRAPCRERVAATRDGELALPCHDGPLREAVTRWSAWRPAPLPAAAGPSVADQLAFEADPFAVAALGAVDRASGRLPVALSFAITVPEGVMPPTDLVVTLDGRPAARVPRPLAPGHHEHTVLLEETAIAEGPNVVDLRLVVGGS